MEIYAECDLCSKWDDLISWKKVAHVCLKCAHKLDLFAPHYYGQGKNSQEVFTTMKEIEDGKGHGRA